jgi:hypothetical protein
VKRLLIALLFGSALGLLAVEAVTPLPRFQTAPYVTAWIEEDPCEVRIEAQAPATKDPLTLHAYWLTPTGETVYGLIQAKRVGGEVWLSVTWPSKPGQPWWARLDWKGGPEDGITSGHTVSCP